MCNIILYLCFLVFKRCFLVCKSIDNIALLSMVKVCKTVIAILLDNKYASYVIAIPLVNNLMPLGHRNIHIVTA